MLSISFLRPLLNTRKCDNFLENIFLKMINFLENINAKTNRVVITTINMVIISSNISLFYVPIVFFFSCGIS